MDRHPTTMGRHAEKDSRAKDINEVQQRMRKANSSTTIGASTDKRETRASIARVNKRRPVLTSVVAFLSVAALGTSLLQPRPVLVWNASPSSPIGLYRVRPWGLPRKGQILVAFAPEAARRLAARRQYLPYRVPLVKPVAAVAGDRVCARSAWILVNGSRVASRLVRDPAARPLPWWNGCRTLAPGEAFLLSSGVIRAFDGRYFGVTKPAQIVGEAVRLWPH